MDGPSLPIGTDFGPRYHVESLLGSGGMGRVYKALDKELDRTVAIKVLRAELMADAVSMQRFKQELLLASQVSHPNILRIHDLGEYKGTKFISMAYVHGGDLTQVLKKDGRLPPTRAVHIMKQLCEALAAAHSANVIHRDLKPQNILIGREDHVYVSDFGLAKTLETTLTALTRAGAVLGTPAYMSPEQVEGKPADHRTDIYALGLIFYEMLTGVLPFTGDSSLQLMYQRVHEAPKRPELLAPDLPAYLSRVCLRCLEKDPAMRYQRASEILEDLRSATPSGPFRTRRFLRPPFSRATWAVGASIALLAALAVGVPAIRRHSVSSGASRNSNKSSGIAPAQKSLVLLPLQTSGQDPTLDYRAQGIVDALSAKLSRMKGLHVTTAAFSQKDKQRSQQDIAQELGAGWILAGNLHETSGKLSVGLSLKNAQTGNTHWSKDFSALPQDLFTLEDQIYNELVTALELKPSNQELAAGATRPTENIEAYDLYLRGRAATRNQRDAKSLQTAIAFFEQSLRKDPGFALAYSGLSDVYLDMYSVTKDSSWPQKALGAALQAEQLGGNKPEVHFSLGSVYRATGKTAEAIVEFNRALELAPSSDEGYRRLGSAYRSAGKKQEALWSYKRAVEINPYYSLNYLQLGAAYLEFGDNANALAAFQRSTELNPNSSLGYSNIGIVYYRQGKWDQCIPAFQKALQIQPSPEAYSNLGTAYFFLRRYAESIDMYEKAVQLDPGSEVYAGNLADAYRASGDLRKASLSYDKAIQLAFKEYRVNPRNADTIASIALYYAKKGDSSNAVDFIQRARAIKPDDVNFIDSQAEILALAGHKEEAIHSVRDALKKGYPLEEIKNDPEFKSLQSLPEFQKLLADAAKKN